MKSIQDSERCLIVGLGNYGSEYDATRHNIGFCLLDNIAGKFGAEFKLDKSLKAEKTTVSMSGKQLILLKPQTYMNNSGDAVVLALKYWKLETEQLLVVHDEVDLPYGSLKLQKGGGNAGHNGLKSVTKHCGNAYYRMRMGVGRPENENYDLSRWVLAKFSVSEANEMTAFLEKTGQALGTLLDLGLLKAQSNYNGQLI